METLEQMRIKNLERNRATENTEKYFRSNKSDIKKKKTFLKNIIINA